MIYIISGIEIILLIFLAIFILIWLITLYRMQINKYDCLKRYYYYCYYKIIKNDPNENLIINGNNNI